MEDEDMFDDSANPETDALLAKYPELAGKNPSDVYSGLMSRYLGSVESERAAREKAAASQAERFKAARADIEQRRYGAPTTSEQLYALSAALLSPRRMPGIAGSLDRIVPALSQMSQLQRSAEEQRAEALAKLDQETAMAQEQALLSGAEGERKSIADLLRFYGPLAKPNTGGVSYDAQRGIFVNRNNPRPTENIYDIGGGRILVQWQDGLWREAQPDGTYRVFERAGNVFEEITEGGTR